MIYHYRIMPRDLEDGILSAFVPELPRCIVYEQARTQVGMQGMHPPTRPKEVLT